MSVTVILLPFPVSVNAMYADGLSRRIKSQRYCDWIIEAGYQLNRQRPKPIKGPFTIAFEFQEGHDNRRRDAFNLEKGVTDLLVKHGIIEADNDLFLRRGSVEWNRDVEGARITIEPLFRNRVPETSGAREDA